MSFGTNHIHFSQGGAQSSAAVAHCGFPEIAFSRYAETLAQRGYRFVNRMIMLLLDSKFETIIPIILHRRKKYKLIFFSRVVRVEQTETPQMMEERVKQCMFFYVFYTISFP